MRSLRIQTLRDLLKEEHDVARTGRAHDRRGPIVARARDAAILAGRVETMGGRDVFALAAAVACGAGYAAWIRPHEAELASLRARVELLDAVAQRVLRMTPGERRQFDALMKWGGPSTR